MNVFNPKILDASIRDITVCLTDIQKADLVLYAVEKLEPSGNTRTLVENAVDSCLHVPHLPRDSIAKARLLRAKSRIAAGSLILAEQDLKSALVEDPNNVEVKALLRDDNESPDFLPTVFYTNSSFSEEIWNEIAQSLSREDLRSLIFVCRMLSRVSRRLLFRRINLQFSHAHAEGGNMEDRDYMNSFLGWRPLGRIFSRGDLDPQTADIITRIIIDPSFACLVRSLRINSPFKDEHGHLNFHTGMLGNALPKLINLRSVECSAGPTVMNVVLAAIQQRNSRLHHLSLRTSEGILDLAPFEFINLQSFSYTSQRGNPAHVHNFLAIHTCSLRTISLNNRLWPVPENAVSMHHLTHMEFTGTVPDGSEALLNIFLFNHQLESLYLNLALIANVSAQFRAMSGSLPFLEHFALIVNIRSRPDADLFPAVTDFLRPRMKLLTLQLTAPPSSTAQRGLGFSASTWGVLPSLSRLKSLNITMPSDLSPSLSSWLVPRSIRALTLDCVTTPSDDLSSLLKEMGTGVPNSLRFIGISAPRTCGSADPYQRALEIVKKGFPMVSVVELGNDYWAVVPAVGGAGVELERWRKNLVQNNIVEWLASLGCEEALWRSGS